MSVISILEKVFGKFKTAMPEDSAHRRCLRCRKRYRVPEPAEFDAAGLVLTQPKKWDVERYCSAQCEEVGPRVDGDSRQLARQRARKIAKEQVAVRMGSGPGASNSRRARRRVMHSLAAKLYRDRAVRP